MVHLKYGEMQEASGKPVEARRAYEYILGEDPNSVGAILGLARLDNLAGRKALAQQGYQRALALQPNDPATLAAVGQHYAAEQQWPQAIQYLNSATMASPNNATFRYELAVALAKSGDVDAAFPHFQSTVGGEAEAHYNIAYLLYEGGNLPAAEQHFAQAAAKKPSMWVAQQMLDEIRTKQSKQRDTMLAQGPNSSPSHVATPQGKVALTGHNQPAATGSRPTTRHSIIQPTSQVRGLVGQWKTTTKTPQEVVASGEYKKWAPQQKQLQNPEAYRPGNPTIGTTNPSGAAPAGYGPSGNMNLRQWEQMQNQLRASGR